MAAACNLLHHLSFPKTPPSPASPLRPSRPHELPLRFPSRRPSSLSLSSTPFSNVSGPLCVGPAPARASALVFRAGYNVQVVVGEDEPEEVLLRRFRREVSKAGVIQECKRRRFFENKQEERKRKAREAGRRNRRRRLASGPRFPSSSAADSEAASKRSSDDLDDNWDLPQGDLPY